MTAGSTLLLLLAAPAASLSGSGAASSVTTASATGTLTIAGSGSASSVTTASGSLSGPPGSDFLVDTLTGTNGTGLAAHVADVGGPWGLLSGAAVESIILDGAGTAYCNGGSGQYQSEVTIPASGPFSIAMDLIVRASPGSISPGPTLNNGVAGQGYRFLNFAGTWYLQTLNAGITINSAPGVISPANSYRITLSYDPATHTVSATAPGGVSISGVESTYTINAVGVASNGADAGSATTGFAIDNINASGVSSAIAGSGSASCSSSASATGTLAIAGSGSAASVTVAAASGSLALAGSGSAASSTAATASGILTIAGSGSALSVTTATASGGIAGVGMGSAFCVTTATATGTLRLRLLRLHRDGPAHVGRRTAALGDGPQPGRDDLDAPRHPARPRPDRLRPPVR
jgi:hypothetical protein